jgi:hypothetical protein
MATLEKPQKPGTTVGDFAELGNLLKASGVKLKKKTAKKSTTAPVKTSNADKPKKAAARPKPDAKSKATEPKVARQKKTNPVPEVNTPVAVEASTGNAKPSTSVPPAIVVGTTPPLVKVETAPAVPTPSIPVQKPVNEHVVQVCMNILRGELGCPPEIFGLLLEVTWWNIPGFNNDEDFPAVVFKECLLDCPLSGRVGIPPGSVGVAFPYVWLQKNGLKNVPLWELGEAGVNIRVVLLPGDADCKVCTLQSLASDQQKAGTLPSEKPP